MWKVHNNQIEKSLIVIYGSCGHCLYLPAFALYYCLMLFALKELCF